MLEISKSRIDWKPNNRKTHQAPILEGINESVRLWDEETNKPVAVQLVLGDRMLEQRRWLTRYLRFNMKWKGANTARLSGIAYSSRTFGTVAPQPLRRRYGCSPDSFNSEHPEAYKMLQEMSSEAVDLMHEYMPEAAERHTKIVNETLHPDWLVPGSQWTSGIINNTAALAYHKDSGNIRDCISAMFGLRSRVGGGGLHIPEYDVTLGIPDGSLSFFDGQALWHGVTPLVNERSDAYRYTIVLYTKSGIKSCGCAEDEPQRAAKRVTQLADNSLNE